MDRDIEPEGLRTVARFRARGGADVDVVRAVCDAIDAALAAHDGGDPQTPGPAGAGFGREPNPSAPLWLPFRDSVGCWRAATHESTSTIYNVFVSPCTVVVRGRRPGAVESPPDDEISRRLLASVHQGIIRAVGVVDIAWYRRDDSREGGMAHPRPFDSV
jgi:hypothetical protein